MEKLSMCRICLATDVRLCSIASHLRVMYERITAMTFKTEDRRPLVACYICHARLQNCYRLRISCLRSEGLYTEMMNSGELVAQQKSSTNSFRMLLVLHFSLGHMLQNSTECHVKEEASEIIHDAELYQNNTEGARDSRNNNTVAESDTEDATTNKIKKEVTEVKTVTKKTGVKNRVTTGKILKTCDKLDTKLNKCENVVTSIVTNVCEESKNNRSLKQNVSSISISKYRQFSCDTCKNSSSHKNHLKNHVRIKSGNKPNQCNVCEKYLTKTDGSSKHEPYECDICNKRFIHKSNLKSHIRIHTGKTPYQCDVCNKCYIKKSNLKTHYRTHTGEKPYQCVVCNKRFNCGSHLKNHTRMHTVKTPYHCDVCNKCFIKKCSVRKL